MHALPPNNKILNKAILTPNGAICQCRLVFFCKMMLESYEESADMFHYQRVRDLREDHDKTQREIADILNMQVTVYQRYERGERELPLWAAIKLADYYHVTLDYLVGRSNR
jgi:DNA-binding XRE family transcriptional regulator